MFVSILHTISQSILYEGGVFLGSILFGASTTFGVIAALKLLKYKSPVNVEIAKSQN